MIDIVLCHSILEKCKSVDAFSENAEHVELVRRIRQHRMVISEELMDFYEAYFEQKGPEWLEWYQTLCIAIFNIRERTIIVTPSSNKCYIKEHAYQNALAAAALSHETKDKMILMEPKRKISNAKNLGISVFNTEDIMDTSGNNLFSMYTLPVNGKSVPEGSESKWIADWLGRFINEEHYIQIFDNYLLTKEGIKYLKKFILKYMANDADIEIYSLKDPEYPELQIKKELSENHDIKQKFSVYYVKNKKDLHARSIQGSKYIIQIDRGLSVFGRDGKTFQSVISIFENNGTPRIVLKESQLTRII